MPDRTQREMQAFRPMLDNNPTVIEDRTKELYCRHGFTTLTDIQAKSLPVICRKKNSILIAPTGSGKTEAAIMPIITMIKESTTLHNKGIKALYITPLRALNNDVFRRIEKYTISQELQLDVRHGDTSSVKKKKMSNDPPDVLITTPETLGVILANSTFIYHLSTVEWVIIDEVHELLPSERGSHLSLSLERLEMAAKKKLVRVGLSASVADPREAGMSPC
jgi:ATP-dependent Lhr-like helicase